jgi:hypothetical protein
MTMKKHFLYLSTAALLAMSFASCVDNDEPRGLRELRYARANKWNAEADSIRSTLYGDSLMRVFQAQTVDLTNRAIELENLKQQAFDEIAIQLRRDSMAIVTAKINVELAEQEYKLAKAKQEGEEKLAIAKAKVIAEQQKLEEAQYKYDKWTAQAKNRQDSITVLVNLEKARLANRLADAQDALNRNKLYADELAAQLEADTYEANLNNLMIIAAAKKNVWEASEDKVWNAYSNMKTKQDAMINKQKDLFIAQQALLIAINGYEVDSATSLKTLKDAVNNKQYALDWAEKSVILAEKELADFKENSQANKETWTKKYNEYQKALDDLDNEEYEYDVQIAEAKAKYSADSLKYKNAKDEIEKPLKEYNDKKGYYTFVLDDAIADDKDFKLPAGSKFTLEQGVIANKDTVRNSKLSNELDAILKVIGNDEKSSNKFYYNAEGVEKANAKIEGFENEIKDAKDKLADTIQMYTAKKEGKLADSVKLQQKLDEYAALTNIKNKYKSDSLAFVNAVKAYKKAALDYEFSEQNGNKSDLYDRFAARLAKAIKEFSQAYKDESEKESPKLYGAEATALNSKRKALLSLAKNGSEEDGSNKYWDLRLKFDGTKPYTDAKSTMAQRFWNFGTSASEAPYNTADAWNNVNNEVRSFDSYIKVSDPSNETAINNLVKQILSANGRASGNAKGENINAYQTYYDAAVAFIGAADRYDVYSEIEVRELKKSNSSKYTSLASTYDYWNWKFKIEDLKKDIAKAQSNDTKDANGKYTNPGADQCDEIMEKAKVYAEGVEAKKLAKIDSVNLKLTNSAKWKELYDAIAEVKDDNDAEIKRLTIAQQEAYNTKLSSFEAAITADQKAIDELELAKGIVSTEKKYKKIAAGAYSKLVLKDVNNHKNATNGGADLTADDIEAEIIIKYAVINLQFAIDEAKEGVEDAKIALENAKKDLEDFKAGEYKANKNNYIATITAKQIAVKDAELDYEHAQKEYEVAQKYYAEILDSVEEE